MAGRKPIVSARQLKARVQIIMRATDKDVAQNSEKNRLIDMTESMREAGVLQEFLLDCLRSKLRQEEGHYNESNRMFEGGHTVHPQLPQDSLLQRQQAPVATSATYVTPAVQSDPVTVDKPASNLPLSHEQNSNLAPANVSGAAPAEEVEAGSESYMSTPSAIIENVVRGIESAAANNEEGFTAPPPAERRRPMRNLLNAMG